MPRPSRLFKSTHPLYSVYTGIMSRCFHEKDNQYPNYGGRGIKVYPAWIKDRDLFFAWAVCSGYQRGKIIDRINNDGDYTPDNCRWVDSKTSSRNRRSAKLDLADACVIRSLIDVGVPYKLLGALYKISIPTISDIKTKRIWSEVTTCGAYI